MKLNYPILMYINEVLAVYTEEAARVLRISFPDNRTMLCMESHREQSLGWILEITGMFRELQPKGKRREWARPFSFLWQLVLSEYSITEGRSITIAELRAYAKDIPDKFPEAPLASDFRRFLNQYADHALVTEDILKSWPM